MTKEHQIVHKFAMFCNHNTILWKLEYLGTISLDSLGLELGSIFVNLI